MNERIIQRRQDYFNALERLKEGVKQEANEIVIDVILHRYEFTFELAWKCMKDCLEYQGIVESIGSPREIIKLSFKHGIIEDGDKWIKMMLDRNTLSHLYDEETSRSVYFNIKNEYIKEFDLLQEKLKFYI